MTGLIISSLVLFLIACVGIVLLFRMLSAILAALSSLALLVALAVVAVVIVPNFVNLEAYKPQLLKAAHDATGREIAIGGPIGFSVWPVLGLELKDISVGNPEGVTPPVMLSASELQVGVSLASLFSGTLDVEKLRLIKAQINLSTDKSGKGNWEISPKSSEPSTKEEKSEKAEPRETESLSHDMALKDMKISKVEIADSSIIYEPYGGNALELNHISVDFAMPSLDSAAKLTASTIYQGMKLAAVMNLSTPRAVMGGQEATLLFTADVNGNATLSYDGKLKGTEAAGKVNAKIKDISALLGALSGKKSDLPVDELTLSTQVQASPSDVSLTDIKLALDDMLTSGRVSAQMKGAKPKITADLDVGSINLDKLVPAGSSEAQAETSEASTGKASSAKAPDLSGLNKAEADITARLAGISGKGLELGATTAKVSLHGGQLLASMTPATLFGGSVEAKVGVSAGKQSFTLASTLKDIGIENALKTFAGSDKLSGHGNLTLNLAGPVGTPDQIKSGLSGSGSMALKNGAIKGVNLAALIRDAKNLLSAGTKATATSTADNASEQTDFTELSGSFSIASGIVSNNDLKMLSPLLRVAGKGTANLPQSSLDYRVETALVADLSGQGGAFDKKGLVIPVFVRGPFSALRYEPDLQGLLLGNLGNDPVGAVKNIGEQFKGKNLKEGAKGLVNGLLGGGQTSTPAPSQDGSTAEPAAKPEAIDPASALKGLLGQ